MKPRLPSTDSVNRLVLRILRLVFPLAMVFGLWTSALADPPTQAGWVADIVGKAWVLDPQSNNWTPLARNQTVAQGDQLRTDARSRISVRVGTTSLWLDELGDLEISELDEGRSVLRLAGGSLGLRLRTQQAANEYQVQTREGTITPESEGLYRMEQSRRGSMAAVLQGRLRFESDPAAPGSRVWLRDGEQSEFWLADGLRVDSQALSRDGFNTWLLEQDRFDNRLSSATERMVSPEMTGVQVLDQYGRWEQVEEYGNLWTPNSVASDWAPYRHGHWAWTRHWGWSWVDDAPWGFAPFHYGRWVLWRGRWGWAPGRFEVRPVYSPALVAWVGGPSLSVGIGVGAPTVGIGWYPLAPHEVYSPAFKHTAGYASRLQWEHGAGKHVPDHSNVHVDGAISWVQERGGPARPAPMPVNPAVKGLPTPPTRHELPEAPVRHPDYDPSRGREETVPAQTRPSEPWSRSRERLQNTDRAPDQVFTAPQRAPAREEIRPHRIQPGAAPEPRSVQSPVVQPAVAPRQSARPDKSDEEQKKDKHEDKLREPRERGRER
jgi:hypothetical protein